MDDSLPWKKLLPILLSRISDAIVWSYCFPFLPAMFASFGLPITEVSVYTGIAESSMVAIEGLIAIPFARLADRVGRKPVLLGSVLSISIAAIGMGTSGAAWQVILWRILVGFNGMVVTRTMVMEITTPQNRTKALALFGPTFSIGLSFASAMGGFLAMPEGRIPVFGDMQLFRRKPFLLPSLAAAITPIVAFPLTLRWLPETRPIRQAGLEAQKGKQVSPTVAQAFSRPGVAISLAAFAVYQVVEFATLAALTLFTTTSIEKGGLGLPVSTAGMMLLIQAVFYAIFTPVAVPFLVKTLGAKRAIVLLMCLWPLVAIQFPLNIWLAGQQSTALRPAVVMLICTRALGCMAWPVYDMITADLSSPETLGLLNALNMVVGSVGRVLGPAAFGMFFGLAATAEPGSMGRASVWIILLVVSLTPAFAALALDLPPADSADQGERQRLLAASEVPQP